MLCRDTHDICDKSLEMCTKMTKNIPLRKNIYGLRGNRNCKGTEDRWGQRNRPPETNEKQRRLRDRREEDGEVVEKKLM